MEKIKVIIEVRGGVVQALYSNTDLQYVLVDFDQLNAGEKPVSDNPLSPDIVTADLPGIYGGNPFGVEIAAKLTQMQF